MNESVIVVDDSTSMRQLVGFTLQEAGYAVELAASAEEALGRIREGRFSMVITDLNMPGLNGIEFIRRIRMTHRFVPVLMLTTESSEAKKQEGREAGVSAWLVKPFTPEVLVCTVKKFVR